MNTYNDDISQLITRVLSGEASADDQKQLDKWLSLSAENKEVFEQYKAVWNISPGPATAAEIDKSAAWKAISAKIDQNTATLPESYTVKRFLYAVSGIAAIMLMAWGVFSFLLPANPKMNRYYATEATPAAIGLADGTWLSLKQGSSISYPATFKGKSRTVSFSGEAYFEVKHNADQPFVVETEHAIIQVLGTAFNVRYNSLENIVEVSVVEGKVSLSPKGGSDQQIILGAGEQGILNTLNLQLSKQAITNYNFMAWKTGILEFTDTGLADVLKTLEQTYGIHAEARTQLNDLKLTARFQDEEPGDIFKTIGILFNLQVAQENNTWVLY